MDKRNLYLSLISEAGLKKHIDLFGYRMYYGKKQATKAEIRIKRTLMDWIGRREYWSNDIGIESIALKADVQREDISAFMRKYLSSKILTVRKELRIEDAKQLLLEHADTPIATIGKMVGIKDKTDFRKQFRECYGMSPSEWRESNSILSAD